MGKLKSNVQNKGAAKAAPPIPRKATPMTWQPIETAPKGATPENPCREHWILGVDDRGEQRVIRWCIEYPCTEGVWMFAYAPSDYIDGIQWFHPTHWMPLPPPPTNDQ